jgi:hypothetical protein
MFWVMVRETDICFAPLERKKFLAVTRSINISPLIGRRKRLALVGEGQHLVTDRYFHS